MSDTRGWWAQKLTGGTPAPYQPAPQYQQPVPQYQPQQPATQVLYDQYGNPVVVPIQQPQQPVYPQQQQPQGFPQQPMSEADAIALARSGQISPAGIAAMVGAKGGGKGARTERELCPECGSNHYFQRKALSKMGKPPAPYCHNCGYNGLFEQYGAQDMPDAAAPGEFD